MATPGDKTSTDWQDGMSLLQSINHVYKTQTLCDVYFTLSSSDGSKKRIGAHTLILASRSPVFQIMFSERWTAENNVVEIEDIQFEIFEEFLKFLYTDTCNIAASTVLELLYTARKYMVSMLCDQCVTYMNGTLDTGMVSTLYQKSCEMGEKELKEKCRKFINKYPEDTIHNEDFVHLGYDALLELISSNELPIENEENVYTACLRWARARCKERGKDVNDGKQCREVLGDVLFQIRLVSLNPDTLAATLGDTQVLTDAELGMVYHSVLTGHTNENITFNLAPRQKQDALEVARFSALVGNETSSEQQPTTDAIQVTPDKDIELRGVTLAADVNKKLPAGTLTIKGPDLNNTSVEFASRSADTLKYRVNIRPVRLLAGKQYELEVVWKKTTKRFQYKLLQNQLGTYYDAYYGHRQCHQVLTSTTVLAHEVNFTFANKSGVASTTAEFGQFPELLFSFP